MKNILLLAMMLTSLEALADPKRLVCEEINTFDGTYRTQEKFEAILDTDDFKKESPKAEVTLLEWSDSQDSDSGDLTIGMTHRLSYEVTPSTISIRIKRKKNYDFITKIDISRKDLTFKNGKCSIEDYSVDNAI